MIRALIADDEALSRRALHQLLERHSDIEIVAECSDGAEAREAIELLMPDVAFLDIRMPLASGLDVARGRANRGKTLVVFITAFDKFALPAFEADAADYLTKPLIESRIDDMLERVRDRVRTRREAELFANHANSGATARKDYTPRLVTRVGLADVVIPVETIDYIEADDVYSAVVSRNKRHLMRMPLDVLERELDPGMFARIHRSYIVRIDRVIGLQRTTKGGARIVVAGGAVLPISRRRRARVASLFGNPPG
jgi:two-component system, LytTR family, response regulator